jgi:hypothetical protein
LHLYSDVLVSNFAFKWVNLYRYTEVASAVEELGDGEAHPVLWKQIKTWFENRRMTQKRLREGTRPVRRPSTSHKALAAPPRKKPSPPASPASPAKKASAAKSPAVKSPAAKSPRQQQQQQQRARQRQQQRKAVQVKQEQRLGCTS